MECNIEIGRNTKSDKNNKDYSYWEKLKKLGLTTLLEGRIRDDLIETFKIINGIFNCDKHFFQYVPMNWKFTFKISKTKPTSQLDLFANKSNIFLKQISESDQK